MRFDLKQLRYFVAVAEEESVGRAAERLHRSQSPLSRQIRQLEDNLGFLLFERRKQRIFLTPEGRRFLVDARHLLQEASELDARTRRLAAGEAGQLDVGFVEGAIWNKSVSTAVRDFHQSHEDIRVELRFMRSLDQHQAVAHHRLNLGFVHTRPDSALALDAALIFEDPFVAAVPAGHALARKRLLVPDDLSTCVWAGPPSPEAGNPDHPAIARCKELGIEIDLRYPVTDIQTALGLIASGLAVCLCQSSIADSSPPGIEFRRVKGLDVSLATYVIWNKAGLSPAGERFLNHLNDRFSFRA